MSISLEDFKSTKRELKSQNGKLSDLFDELDDKKEAGKDRMR